MKANMYWEYEEKKAYTTGGSQSHVHRKAHIDRHFFTFPESHEGDDTTGRASDLDQIESLARPRFEGGILAEQMAILHRLQPFDNLLDGILREAVVGGLSF
jgi:hypothetical protein